MNKSVLIPLCLLMKVIELLEYWDTSHYDRVIQDDCRDVLAALKVKLQKLELREAYANIINAKNPDDRDWARIEYLRLRNQLGSVGVGF